MTRRNHHTLIRIFLAFSLILSAMPYGTAVRAQDIIASDDISGGSSVFVFRQSRKKPQVRSAHMQAYASRGAAGSVSRRRVNAYVASHTRTRRTPSLVKNTASIRAAAAEKRRIALSNTLTATADKMFESKDVDGAIANYRQARKEYPKNTNAKDGLSDALTAKGITVAGDSGNLNGAEFLAEAVTLDPKDLAAYAKLGEIYDANDQNAKAIESYESALRIDPAFTEVYVPLGIAYFKAGEIAKADVYATKAEANGTETADGRYLRGLVQFKQNKDNEALASFDRAIVLDPNIVTAYYYRGQVFDRQQHDDQALASYKQAVTRDSTFAPAWFEIGVVSYNAGDYTTAAGAYQQTVQYEPDNAEAHANLASSYRQLERYPDANKEYWLASNGIKNDPDLHSEWGYCLGKTNEWDKAVKQETTAQEISPTAVDYTNVGWAYYNAAEADKQAKNDASASANYEIGKAFLQKAVATNPNFDAAYLNLGSTYNALGDFQNAVATLNHAVDLHANWVIALNQLGVGYRGTNNLSAAASAFNRV
ncbi:MAG: tetratricopeptide repeat protein, partial [Acidobacteriota bacterium]